MTVVMQNSCQVTDGIYCAMPYACTLLPNVRVMGILAPSEQKLPLSEQPGQGQPCALRLNALTSASVALLLRNPRLAGGRPRDQIEDEARRADTPGTESRRRFASSHSFTPH